MSILTLPHMHIIPALLTTDTQDLRSQLEKLLPHFSHFQIDIQDGVFVPSHTLTINEYISVLREFPMHKNLTIDFHLMLIDYTDALMQIEEEVKPALHVRTVYVHTNIDKKLLSSSTSLTFNPEDRVEEWSGFLKESKYAQVMTIHPGPQGQAFMPEQLTKVGQIRSINSSCVICIDGAVSEKSTDVIRSQKHDCMPDECAVGSCFSKSPPAEIANRLCVLQGA